MVSTGRTKYLYKGAPCLAPLVVEGMEAAVFSPGQLSRQGWHPVRSMTAAASERRHIRENRPRAGVEQVKAAGISGGGFNLKRFGHFPGTGAELIEVFVGASIQIVVNLIRAEQSGIIPSL